MRRIAIVCCGAVLFVSSSAVFAVDHLVPSQYPTIQAAIDAAGDGDTVVAAQGTYYENINVGGKRITLTSTDPNDPNVVAGTVIDASGSGRVLTFSNTVSANCVLAGLTITGGNSSSYGGGIRSWVGAITINNCIIAHNFSASDGGGIRNSEADLTLAGCTFIGNMADYDGGGIANWFGNLTMTDCTFSGNSAGQDGGGIRNISAELMMTDCAFVGNSAAGEGGGIATDYHSAILTNCTFKGNSATWGGGINNSHVGSTATNCIFSGNSAQHGAGICTFNLHLYDQTLRLHNCTFSGNIANGYGGAVCNRQLGNLILTNCVLWANSANEGPQIAIEQIGSVAISYSCVQGGQWDVYAPSAVLDWLDGNLEDDPCFVDADGSDNAMGTEDDNLRLMPGSPCIDEGNNIAVPADTADLDNDGNTAERTPLDLDYGQRFADDPCTADNGLPDPPGYVEVVDMGAYEYRYYCNTCWDAAECRGQGAGDTTCDGNVDLADLFALKAHFGKAAPWTGNECCADFSHDGSVNLADLFALKAGFGTSGYSPSSGNQNCPP